MASEQQVAVRVVIGESCGTAGSVSPPASNNAGVELLCMVLVKIALENKGRCQHIVTSELK